MRLFVAIDIEPRIRERLAEYRAEMKPLAPNARWVGIETYHITLKFLGEKSPQQMEDITRALAAIQAPQVLLSFAGTGFFPNPRSARVFWVGIHADHELAVLVRQVDDTLSTLRIPREDKPFAPHLTLARSGSGRPQTRSGDHQNSLFAPLQQKLAMLAPPDFGSMTASKFFLYDSKLSPSGAHYTKLARFPLG